MPVLEIEDTRGGISLEDPENIADNQFEEATNWCYNSEKRLQTRYGITEYFEDIPDSVVVVDACNNTSGWSASDDAYGLGGATAIRGSGALKFSIAIAGSANDFATVEKSTLVVNLTNTKGYLGFWLNVPAGFNTNLTDFRLRLGSDSSNYYEWILPTLIEGENDFIKLLFSDATIVGTPVDATITYIRLRPTYNASYLNQYNIVFDDIRAYSATNFKPPTSYFYHQRDDTQERIALVIAGSNMFHWLEDSETWENIDTGLTEFETAEGMTTFRTRWSFGVYKNVFYMCNGVDNYRSWDGTIITQYASQPKIRYLLYMADRLFGIGEDINPITLYYINALAADASNLSANAVVVGGDESGKANGLFELGSFQLVGKAGKIYTISVSGTGSATAIDSQNGLYSHRATQNVGNAILYQNNQGIDNLKQKAAATGAAAIQSEPYTNDLNKLVRRIKPRQFNASCGLYIQEIFNYYWTFDTGNDNLPDTTLVYSSLIGKTWTKYLYPAIYDYGMYVDADGNRAYVAASAQTGKIYRIENGFTDLGRVINWRLKTKKYLFGDPSSWKDFHSVDIFGFRNLGTTAYVEVIVDGVTVYTDTITDENSEDPSSSVTIASDPIADQPIGGGASEEDDGIILTPFRIRLGGESMASGRNIQVLIYNTNDSVVMTLDKMRFRYDLNSEDIFF